MAVRLKRGCAMEPVVFRMIERSLIVAGGILSIYLGYRLFTLGIDKSQGRASAFGIELRNFGPGLFFAGLGAFVLVTTMKASIQVGATPDVPAKDTALTATETAIGAPATLLFFGIEDPERKAEKWSALSFFFDARDLLRRLESGQSAEALADIRKSIQGKLDSITMTPEEYQRFQMLTNKVPLSAGEQIDLQNLEGKLIP